MRFVKANDRGRLREIQAGPERELRSAFERVVDMYASSPAMIQLSGMIGLPKSWMILEAVKLVWEKQWREVIRVKADERRVVAQQEAAKENTARGLVQLPGGQWVAKTDARVQPLYVDMKGRPTTVAQGQTPGAVLVATMNTLTDVVVGGMGRYIV